MMAWIKRNLFFVLGIVAGMALTVYCGILFASDLKKNGELTRKFEQADLGFAQVKGKPLFPSEANILLINQDRTNLEVFRDELRRKFAPFPTPPKENEQGFSAYLENTIAELTAKADAGAVTLPTNMSFGFTDQRSKLKYAAENIQPWMRQLSEIKVLCGILFNAKINALVSLRRVAVSTNDFITTQSDFFQARMTNTPLGSITPYKIEFRCFTRELDDVIKGLSQSSNCFVIKDIEVMPAGKREGEVVQAEPEQPETPVVTNTPPARRGGTNAPPARRGATPAPPAPTPVAPGTPGMPGTQPGRGRGRRAGLEGLQPAGPIPVAVTITPPATPAPAPTRAPAAPGSPLFMPGTILREQPLMIMISVEAIRFN
jgi:hypothetical protein